MSGSFFSAHLLCMSVGSPSLLFAEMMMCQEPVCSRSTRDDHEGHRREEGSDSSRQGACIDGSRPIKGTQNVNAPTRERGGARSPDRKEQSHGVARPRDSPVDGPASQDRYVHYSEGGYPGRCPPPCSLPAGRRVSTRGGTTAWSRVVPAER